MATKDDVVTIKFDINSLQWKVIDELREQTKYKSEKNMSIDIHVIKLLVG